MGIYKIGITGGMGCGKSELLRYLGETFPRIYTIDLDKLAFRNYDLNKWSLRNIEHSFGQESMLRDQFGNITGINRPFLSKNAFKSKDRLNCLKQIVSPGIKIALLEKFKEIEYKKQMRIDGFKDYSLVAVEGAVLIESNTSKFFDELWVLTLDK